MKLVKFGYIYSKLSDQLVHFYWYKVAVSVVFWMHTKICYIQLDQGFGVKPSIDTYRVESIYL